MEGAASGDNKAAGESGESSGDRSVTTVTAARPRSEKDTEGKDDADKDKVG